MKKITALFLSLALGFNVFLPQAVSANQNDAFAKKVLGGVETETSTVVKKTPAQQGQEANKDKQLPLPSKKFNAAEAFIKDSLVKLKGEKVKSLIVEFTDDEASAALAAIKKIPGVQVKWEYNSLIKGASFSLPVEHLSKLAEIDGIKHIEENKPVIPLMNNSKALVDLVKWTAEKKGNYYADGRGMVIALLDSGVDTSHKDIKHMDPEAMDARKIKDITPVPSHTENPFNAKVPHGFNYVEGNYVLTDNISSPHGQHIAGTLVGNSPDENGIKGIAPNAQLLAYKVFSDDRKKPSFPGNDSVYHAILDAIAHKADVISLSIGLYGSGMENDIYNSIIKKATEAGVVVVAAMGNWSASSSSSTFDRWANKSIPTKDTSSMVSIAATPYALGVGSAQNIHVDANTMIVDGEKIPNYNIGIYTEGLLFPEGKDANQGKVKVVNAGFLREDNEYKDLAKMQVEKKIDFKDTVLLVRRGINLVSEKIYCAQNLGAKGLILVNGNIHENRDDFMKRVITDYTFIKVHIEWKKNKDDVWEEDKRYDLNRTWAVTITGADGAKLLSKMPNLGESTQMNLAFTKDVYKIQLAEKDKPHISGFSSWGPTIDLELKPEIVAPGQDIFSTFNNREGKPTYGYMSGTSMATPHVAGLATLLLQKVRQLAPLKDGAETNLSHYTSGDLIKLTNVELTKILLMNTAIPVIDQKTAGLEYSPRVQGAGMANIDRAFNTDVLIVGGPQHNKAYVALKEIKDQKAKFSVIVHNFGEKTRNFKIRNGKVLTETVIQENKAEFNDTTGTKRGEVSEDGSLLIEKVNEIHPKEVPGAKLSSNGFVTIAPKASVQVDFELDTAAAETGFVEGYVYFDSQDNEQADLSLPYFGFKGSWAGERIIDLPVWDKGSLIKLTSVFSEKKGFENHDTINYIELGKETKDSEIIPENITITSKDGHGSEMSWATNKNIVPRFIFLRDAVDYKAEIIDASDRVVTRVNAGHFPEKALFFKYGEGHTNKDSYKILPAFKWDGQYFNQDIHYLSEVKEGQYRYRLSARIAKDKPWEVLDIPFYVDNTAPTLEYKHDSSAKTVKITAKDNRKIWYVGATLDNVEQTVEKIAEGEYQIKNLNLNPATTNKLKIFVLDYAGLLAKEEKELTPGDDKNPARTPIELDETFMKANFTNYFEKKENFKEKVEDRAPVEVDLWNWATYGLQTAQTDNMVRFFNGVTKFRVPVSSLQDKTKVVIETRNFSKTDYDNEHYDPAKNGKNHPVLAREEYYSKPTLWRNNWVEIKEGWNYIYVTAYPVDWDSMGDDFEEDEDSSYEEDEDDEDSADYHDKQTKYDTQKVDMSRYKYKDKPSFAEGYVVYYDYHAPRLEFKTPILWDQKKYDNPMSGTHGGRTQEGEVYIVDGKVNLHGAISDNGNAWQLKINNDVVDYFNNYEKEDENYQTWSYVREAKEGDIFEVEIEDGQHNIRKFELKAIEPPTIPDFTIEADDSNQPITLDGLEDEEEDEDSGSESSENEEEDPWYKVPLTEEQAKKVEKTIRVNGKLYEKGQPLNKYKVGDSDGYNIEVRAYNKAGMEKIVTKKIGNVPEFKAPETVAVGQVANKDFTLKQNEFTTTEMKKALAEMEAVFEKEKATNAIAPSVQAFFNIPETVSAKIIALTKVADSQPLSQIGHQINDQEKNMKVQTGVMKMDVRFIDPYGQSFEKTYYIRLTNFAKQDDLQAKVKKESFTLDEIKDLNNIFEADQGTSFVLVNPIKVPESGLSEKITGRVRVFKNGQQNEMDFAFVLLQDAGLKAELKKDHFYPDELGKLENIFLVPAGVKMELVEPKTLQNAPIGQMKVKLKLTDPFGLVKEEEHTFSVLNRPSFDPNRKSGTLAFKKPLTMNSGSGNGFGFDSSDSSNSTDSKNSFGKMNDDPLTWGDVTNAKSNQQAATKTQTQIASQQGDGKNQVATTPTTTATIAPTQAANQDANQADKQAGNQGQKQDEKLNQQDSKVDKKSPSPAESKLDQKMNNKADDKGKKADKKADATTPEKAANDGQKTEGGFNFTLVIIGLAIAFSLGGLIFMLLRKKK